MSFDGNKVNDEKAQSELHSLNYKVDDLVKEQRETNRLLRALLKAMGGNNDKGDENMVSSPTPEPQSVSAVKRVSRSKMSQADKDFLRDCGEAA